MKSEDKFTLLFAIVALIAMMVNTFIVDIRVGQEIHVNSFITYLGCLVVMLLIWFPCLFLSNRSVVLSCAVCLLGFIGMHLLFDWYFHFAQSRGVVFQEAGDWFSGKRDETTIAVEDNIRYYRTHFPHGTMAGTALAVIQWAELQFILLLPVVVCIRLVLLRKRTKYR